MEYFSALLLERKLLSAAHSTKKTFHFSLSIKGSNFFFEPGDSIGMLPTNAKTVVEEILQWLKTPYNQEVIDPKTNLQLPLGQFLEKKANLSKVTSKLKTALQIDPAIDELDVEEAIKLSSSPIRPQEFISFLLPLLPRFYSIASSPHVYPDEIHLLVTSAEYKIQNKMKLGVASKYLCEDATPLETHIPIYIQAAKHFHLPASLDASIIFIGPGTGVAPFRAFMQERISLGHTGKNWLFFGERNSSSDFYYKDFWLELVHQNKLKLNTAFSRETLEKCYVQHRLLESQDEVWDWIKNGAFIYVCGDASKMAKDVEAAFCQIFESVGKMNHVEARSFLKSLRQNLHYLTDVY